MKLPTVQQTRTLAIDVVVSTAVEMAMVRLARRLKRGRRTPPRRPLRRFAGALVNEMVEEGAASMYMQRLRMRAAIDRAAAQSATSSRVRLTQLPQISQIPQQRRSSQSAPAHAPMRTRPPVAAAPAHRR